MSTCFLLVTLFSSSSGRLMIVTGVADTDEREGLALSRISPALQFA